MSLPPTTISVDNNPMATGSYKISKPTELSLDLLVHPNQNVRSKAPNSTINNQ
jgi:hypothetical protein